ncbi:MAG TPA: hypothetical protein VN916_02060 [Candidatus Acidoferrum sp.]|nr:hypothetical protein [Candidatus Acidoferrum sp.]
MARLITRRKLLIGLAASTALAGCDGRSAARAFLAGMERWNERVDRLLFSQNRLAPTIRAISRSCTPFHSATADQPSTQ